MNHIELRVKFNGSERLLRLLRVNSEWHARLLVPGRKDMLTQECPEPSPPGVKLPQIDVNDLTLRIDAYSEKVESLGMVKLIASGGVYLKDGQFVVELKSLMWDSRDGMYEREQKKQRAQVLTFPKQRNRGERDMER